MPGQGHRLTEPLKYTLQVGGHAGGATAQMGQAEWGMGGARLQERGEVSRVMAHFVPAGTLRKSALPCWGGPQELSGFFMFLKPSLSLREYPVSQ